MCWGYDLNPHMPELSRNQVVTKGKDATTINLLEFVWRVDDSIRDTSKFSRQAENALRSSSVERGQRGNSVVDEPMWRIA